MTIALAGLGSIATAAIQRCASVAGAENEQRRVLEEQLRVLGAAEPAAASWVVLPAGLDRVVGDVHLVAGVEVLAEDDRDPIGQLLRIRRRDAEDAHAEVAWSRRSRPGDRCLSCD